MSTIVPLPPMNILHTFLKNGIFEPLHGWSWIWVRTVVLLEGWKFLTSFVVLCNFGNFRVKLFVSYYERFLKYLQIAFLALKFSTLEGLVSDKPVFLFKKTCNPINQGSRLNLFNSGHPGKLWPRGKSLKYLAYEISHFSKEFLPQGYEISDFL